MHRARLGVLLVGRAGRAGPRRARPPRRTPARSACRPARAPSRPGSRPPGLPGHGDLHAGGPYRPSGSRSAGRCPRHMPRAGRAVPRRGRTATSVSSGRLPPRPRVGVQQPDPAAHVVRVPGPGQGEVRPEPRAVDLDARPGWRRPGSRWRAGPARCGRARRGRGRPRAPRAPRRSGTRRRRRSRVSNAVRRARRPAQPLDQVVELPVRHVGEEGEGHVHLVGAGPSGTRPRRGVRRGTRRGARAPPAAAPARRTAASSSRSDVGAERGADRVGDRHREQPADARCARRPGARGRSRTARCPSR